jgi:predicted hydrolase (HD superfamily)
LKVVEFECGCIGLRDFDTEETIIFRHCEYSPDDVMFYRATKDDHGKKLSKDLSTVDANFWIATIAALIRDGKKLRQIRKLMKE